MIRNSNASKKRRNTGRINEVLWAGAVPNALFMGFVTNLSETPRMIAVREFLQGISTAITMRSLRALVMRNLF